MSGAVLAATGSVLTNKYTEGYPGKRYYEGQQYIDQVEQLCIDRAKALFGAEHVNVQPYSGSPANLAVYLAFCKPGDTIMGMGLPAGGHLTHGWNVSITGSYFKRVQYGVRKDTHRIDFDEVRELARKEQPKLLFCGGTAIPRTIDFAAFGEIADEVGAMLVADIAHIAGLVAGGAHPVADRGRRRRDDHDAQDAARSARRHADVQGRARQGDRSRRVPRPAGRPAQPHHRRHRGRAASEAATAEFKTYAHQIVANAKALAAALVERGFTLVTGGTDNHLILVDLTTQERVRQDRREGARRRRHRAQLQLGAVRPAQAVRSVGHPHRHAGGHQPRHEGSRDDADRGVDGSTVVARRPTLRCTRRSPARCASCARSSRRRASAGLAAGLRRRAQPLDDAVEDPVRDLGLRAGRDVGDAARVDELDVVGVDREAGAGLGDVVRDDQIAASSTRASSCAFAITSWVSAAKPTSSGRLPLRVLPSSASRSGLATSSICGFAPSSPRLSFFFGDACAGR